MINQKIVSSYQDFHGRQFQGNIAELFYGVDRTFAFGLIDLINRGEDEYGHTAGLVTFLQRWFSRTNQHALADYVGMIRGLARRRGFEETEIIIFNPHSTLAYIESLLIYLKGAPAEQAARPTNEQMELNLLNAYLVVNQQLSRINNGLELIQQSYPREAIYWLSMNKAFQYADLLEGNPQELFITEVGKAILLFEHLEASPLANPILEHFVLKYNCGNWMQYLKAISGMSAAGFDTANFKGNTLIEIDPQLPFYQTCLRILDQITVEIDLAEFSGDFLYLRNHPIHRQGENKFQILCRRFFIEKIFRALYFELRGINQDLKVMSDTKFRTVTYTSGYSENTLFYSVLDKIFDKASLRKHGNELEKADPGFGASDYLSYQNQSVFIFESKDILIKKEVKERLFIPEMREEFRKKFYKDGNADKAVLQLARNVKNQLEGRFCRFGFCPMKYRFIYPIIVVHSESFNILGINQILFQWFGEACREVGISKKQMYKVKPVVIVDISTLMYFQDTLNKNKVGLNEIIDSYHARTSLPLDHVNATYSVLEFQSRFLIPFSLFLDRKIKKVKRVRAPANLVSRIRRIYPKF